MTNLVETLKTKIMEMKLELITPKMASKLLGNNDSNRKLSENIVRIYAEYIDNDQWLITPQGISIASDGTLLDGQHRLSAIIKANKSVKMNIFYNVDKEVFKVLDTGKKRTGADVLHIEGIKNATNIAAGIKKYNILNIGSMSTNGGYNSLKFSNTDILNEYNKNPTLCQNIHKIAISCYTKLRIIQSSDIFGFIYYLINKKKYSIEVVESFFKQLHFNENVENNTINMLRDKLVNSHLSNIKMTSAMKNALIIKTWNSYIDGREYKCLRYNVNEDNKVKLK